jgi:GAF domain-containing protein
MAEWSDVELARMFAETAKALAGQESLGKTADELVTLAVAVVPGVESAGVTLARNGKVETLAATDELVLSCDAAQYETAEGPCLDAVWSDRILLVNDLATDLRWPAFAKRAVELGAASMLACHLSSERGTLSALNMYARQTNSFDDQSKRLSLIFATHATIALEFARLEGDLRAAVETRQGIGQAVGIVMERHKLTAKQAFDLLVRSSQRLNIKMRDLADAVVSTGLEPSDVLLASLAGDPDLARRGPGRDAAEQHEGAARIHEQQAAAKRAEADEHDRKARQHRQAAAAARTATRIDDPA